MIAVSPMQRACTGVSPVLSAIFAKGPLLSESYSIDKPSLTVGLLPQLLLPKILCHPQLCAVIDPLEFNFVHERLNQLQSPTTATIFLVTFSVGLLTVLARKTCRHHAATRNSNN